jgi:hypothetical protein
MGGLPEAEGYVGSREEIQTPMVSQKAVVAVGADVADIAVGVESGRWSERVRENFESSHSNAVFSLYIVYPQRSLCIAPEPST